MSEPNREVKYYANTVMVADREVKFYANTVMVTLQCLKCDNGVMESTGISQTTNPARYMHRCNKCGNEEAISGKTYPYIQYERIG